MIDPARTQAAIDFFADAMTKTREVVFLTGAGMSTESGVPDFRSSNGLWKDRDIMKLASPYGLAKDFEAYTEFYRWRMAGVHSCRPNEGHEILARWYVQGRIGRIITQNVDGFHQQAGAGEVVELHGSLRSVRCSDCGAGWSDVEYLDEGGNRCDCGGKMRPNVVMFGEALPDTAIEAAVLACERAKLLVVLGSSLAVSPANRLPLLAQRNGATFIIVNKTPTDLDDLADAVIQAPIGETLRLLAHRTPGA